MQKGMRALPRLQKNIEWTGGDLNPHHSGDITRNSPFFSETYWSQSVGYSRLQGRFFFSGCCFGGLGFYLLSLAFTRINPAIITKVMPVMPLTSLSDNGMPGWPQVTRRASTAKINANIKTSNPATILFHWNTFMK
jgi:hypothetical protein